MRVAITGASGLIGARLLARLRQQGHEGVALARGQDGTDFWNVETGAIGIAGRVDAIVHLAGRNIASRWTARAKREIWDSRVPATQRLARFLASVPDSQRPKTLIAASAIGIYGDRGDEILTEVSPTAPDGASFLSDLCRAWEAATKPAEDAGIRVVHVRLGIVLARDGGALAKLVTPTKLGLGGPVGSGTQWMSWIALDDVAHLFARLLTTEARGPVNAVAGATRQHEFMRTLGHVVHRPTVFPLPTFMVKTIFGQMGREALLASQRVTATRLPADFSFEHPTLEAAIRAALGP